MSDTLFKRMKDLPSTHLLGTGTPMCAGAQGVRDALDILLEQKRLSSAEDLQAVVLTGDGAAYGMGLSAATSGAIERGLDFLYICNDFGGRIGQHGKAALRCTVCHEDYDVTPDAL